MMTRGRLFYGKHELSIPRAYPYQTSNFANPYTLTRYTTGSSRRLNVNGEDGSRENSRTAGYYGEGKSKPKGKVAERDFFLSVLSSSATKRDAKSYLSRFHKPTTRPERRAAGSGKRRDDQSTGQGNYENRRPNKAVANLGNLYAPKAIDESPVFMQEPRPEQLIEDAHRPLHIALVKLRAPQLLDDDTLEGVAITLSQLSRLGLNSVVIVDCEEDGPSGIDGASILQWRQNVIAQAERVTSAIGSHNSAGARCVDCAVGVSPLQREITSTVRVRDDVLVQHPIMLLRPLRKQVIPVVPPIAYTISNQRVARVGAGEVLLALTREFAGLTSGNRHAPRIDDIIETTNEKADDPKEQVFVERIILLDPLGGIPATDRPSKAHVFINLEQEYEDIRRELQGDIQPAQADEDDFTSSDVANHGRQKSVFGVNNPFSGPIERQVVSIPPNATPTQGRGSTTEWASSSQRHLRNLNLLQQALALLPPSSSALVTTPQEASNSALLFGGAMEELGVETRRQLNPLIHSLLTDKPTVSSSLPVARLGSPEPGVLPAVANRANPGTFIKRGMPLTIIPDPRCQPWQPPCPDQAPISLSDPRIDLSRTLHLIEDSFGRPLDVTHYLNRLSHTTAGIIIAGRYDGGAILTWELPPGITNDGTETIRRRMVPYLDKFAVLRRSQGAGGVADIVFKAMVRSCFPDGVCWRSRKNNPVNKWYFERAEGSWKLPGSNWTMFWTTEDLAEDKQRWLDYVEVCKGVQPSWADNKTVVD